MTRSEINGGLYRVGLSAMVAALTMKKHRLALPIASRE